MSPIARPSTVVAACLLGAVSGSVDVLVFTRLGDVFASVITGNVVVVGVAIGGGHLGVMAHAGVAVLSYAVGVVVATLMTRSDDGRSVRAVYLAQFALLVGLSVVWVLADARPQGPAEFIGLICAATAMGMQSRAFAMQALPGVATTYFTGTLTGLLTGLVTESRLNVPAAAALMSLLGGAAGSGLLVAQVPIAAPALPLALLAGALVVVRPTGPTGQSRPRS